ncbi:putative NAD(P)-binding protein [Seiridium unicorne]|uniref:NAD(P)-binding protein n=1 Tax=Seiridium unicorne TaxID=138068 RepID=A0ABR2V5Q8_9PEZI
MPTIAVLGATGVQGGSIIRQLQKSSTWTIRGLTRNTSSDKAKALNIEVVAADVNNEASLVQAFEGVDALFAVTSFWESMPTLGRDGAGEEETQQLKNIANAAQKIPTLKHYIVSALPPAGKMSGGKLKVPHLDYKQKALDWMKEATPDLYRKTSQVWPGWYPTNLAALPMVKFWEVPGSYGAYLWAQPSRPDALLPIAGDIAYNFGVVVEGVLNAGEQAFGKVALCITEYLPLTDVVAAFEEVTGKRAAYVEISDETIAKLFGDYGAEYAAQLRWSEAFPDWAKVDSVNYISAEKMGIEGKLVGLKDALNSIKSQII